VFELLKLPPPITGAEADQYSLILPSHHEERSAD